MSQAKLSYFNPPNLIPPHRVTRPDQVEDLIGDMLRNGWHGDALVGYWFQDQVQLLNGTHRREGAIGARLGFIPIMVWPFKLILEAWGKDEWYNIMLSGDGLGGPPRPRPVLLGKRIGP